ncbi:MAG: NADP-dependent oxidoreductase [Sphingomonadaceae bacterium]
MKNRTVRLARRPTGLPGPDTWTITDEEVTRPAEGEVLVEVKALSLDPAMRGWLNEGKSYIPPVGIGEVMRASGTGVILESSDPRFVPGDAVMGGLGVQRFATVRGKDVEPIDLAVAPFERWLGVLGMPGMTAWFGLFDVGALQDGETVVVSAAAGAVGGLVVQLAKRRGCHVVGIAGGPDKCRVVVEEFGADACIDYKAGPVLKPLAEAVPKGIHVYFDNVGGEILEAAMTLLARRARVVICGAISGYNDFANIRGPRNYLNLLVQRARMEGFVVFDYAPRFAEARAEIAKGLKDGSIRAVEDVRDGIDTFPDVLPLLYTGGNVGKLVLRP